MFACLLFSCAAKTVKVFLTRKAPLNKPNYTYSLSLNFVLFCTSSPQVIDRSLFLILSLLQVLETLGIIYTSLAKRKELLHLIPLSREGVQCRLFCQFCKNFLKPPLRQQTNFSFPSSFLAETNEPTFLNFFFLLLSSQGNHPKEDGGGEGKGKSQLAGGGRKRKKWRMEKASPVPKFSLLLLEDRGEKENSPPFSKIIEIEDCSFRIPENWGVKSAFSGRKRCKNSLIPAYVLGSIWE